MLCVRKRLLAVYAAIIICVAVTLTYFNPLRFTGIEPVLANPAPQVIPALREWHGGSDYFVVQPTTRITVDAADVSQLMETALVFQQDVFTVTGRRLAIHTDSTPVANDFFLSLRNAGSGLGNEGYTLDIGKSVVVRATSSAGVFYATRTLLQMVQQDPAKIHIPRGQSRDFPSYRERGFMLDVGRKFFSLQFLEDYVKFMSWYKMNDFHLHFNDNELHVGNDPNWMHKYAAFRLNSPHFPGLAAKDGSYSEADIRALEQVAKAYHVTITPEIDAPAHALAFTQYRPALASQQYSKEFLDLSNPATFTFLNDIWNTFLPWFDASQVSIGADEYELTDPDHWRLFVNAYDAFLHSKGKTVRMWGSMSKLQSTIPINKDIVIDVWDNGWANPLEMVNQGYSIINMNDNLLYIVPKAGYFHDFLDTKTLYEQWEPEIFSLSNPQMNLSPGNPLLLGGMFAEWNDKLGSVISDADVHARVKPAMQTLSQKLWSGPTDIPYGVFQQVAASLGDGPGTHLPQVSSW